MRKRQNENGIRGILLLKNLLKIMLFALITTIKTSFVTLQFITQNYTILYCLLTQQI